MTIGRTALVLIAIPLALTGCTYHEIRAPIAAQEADRADIETFGPVSFQQLAPDIWQHTSYLDVPGFGGVSSNGLLVVDGGSSLLVDTAWTSDQTEAIVRWAETRLGKPIRAAVVTHAHSDKMGGMAALHNANIATYANALTNRLAPENGLIPANYDIAFDAKGWAIGHAAQVLAPLKIYSPGGGHSADNITVGVGSASLAFGGCLIKGTDAPSLGNLADADISHYATAVSNFGAAFPDAKIIAMSHSPAEGRAAIAHSVKMAKELN
ncbi:MAG: subclass B1 metallo-beta-lactamase [Pontixanthobacter sp.]